MMHRNMLENIWERLESMCARGRTIPDEKYEKILLFSAPDPPLTSLGTRDERGILIDFGWFRSVKSRPGGFGSGVKYKTLLWYIETC